MAAPTITSDLSLLADASLTSATNRAYREAARSWAEYRRSPSGDLGRILLTSAEAAEEWWQMLLDEQTGRLEEAPVEDRSSDVYTVPATALVTPTFSRVECVAAAS
jgi:hypothetical protein